MDNKNLILAITLSIGILLLWSAVFEAPQQNTPINNVVKIKLFYLFKGITLSLACFS